MRIRIYFGFISGSLSLIYAASNIAMAQEQSSTSCPQVIAPTGGLAPWTTPKPLKTAKNAKSLSKAQLIVGHAATLTLHKSPSVRFQTEVKNRDDQNNYGGLIGLTIAEEGTYSVALQSGGWIDIVNGGKTLSSVKHGHGPECSDIRKMVDFNLAPGSYTIQISGASTAENRILVTRRP